MPTCRAGALAADRRGRGTRRGRGRQAFYSTDTQADATDVLTWYARRWSIEVAFHDSKQPRVGYYSGFEEPQGWSRPSATRTAPVAMLLYSLIVVWFHQEGHLQPEQTSWYHQQHASFGAMLPRFSAKVYANGLLAGAFTDQARRKFRKPWKTPRHSPRKSAKAERKELAKIIKPYADGHGTGWKKLAAEHPEKAIVVERITQDLAGRIEILIELGLGYLTFERSTPTLSPGELQRLRLATQVHSNLFGVVYVLDEPSAGLHPADTEALLAALDRLKAAGNSIFVVEHELDVIRHADWIVDVGPDAGEHGGERYFTEAHPRA